MLACLALIVAQSSHAIDPDRAYALFQEAAELSGRDGGKLWGKPLYGPMIFADRETLEVVANQPDKQGALHPEGHVFVGKLPQSFGIANYAADWSGVTWTMVMWPLPGLNHSRGQLMMHECYHRIQASLGLPAADVANDHLDSENGRIWMRMEMRALADAVQSTGADRRRAEQDALLFRARRGALCGAATMENERKLEMNEGLAEYTGLMLSGFAKVSLPARAAVRLENEQTSTTFARSFAYATGPAYGILLDEVRPNWRKGLRASDSLASLLASALRVTATDDEAMANTRLAKYDGAFMASIEHSRAVERARHIAEYRQKFVDGPVLSLPTSGSLSYTYDPNGMDSLPEAGQIIMSGKVSDDWGTLGVSDGGFLLCRAKGLVTGVTVSVRGAPAGPEVNGEGWTLHLNPGWVLVADARAGSWKVVKAAPLT